MFRIGECIKRHRLQIVAEGEMVCVLTHTDVIFIIYKGFPLLAWICFLANAKHYAIQLHNTRANI